MSCDAIEGDVLYEKLEQKNRSLLLLNRLHM